MRLAVMIASLMPFLAFAQEIDYKPNTVIVIATPGYEWAAHDVANVLLVNTSPQEISLKAAYDIMQDNENVVGLVEVELNLDQFYETVYAICRDSNGKEVWKKKRMLNFGGGKERLAKDMVGGLLKKVKGKTCPYT